MRIIFFIKPQTRFVHLSLQKTRTEDFYADVKIFYVYINNLELSEFLILTIANKIKKKSYINKKITFLLKK
jgi:hypothetical protein